MTNFVHFTIKNTILLAIFSLVGIVMYILLF